MGGLAQLARAPALHAGGHRFDSDILHLNNAVKKDYQTKGLIKIEIVISKSIALSNSL